MTRRDRLCTRMARLLDDLLGSSVSWSGDVEGAMGLDGRRVRWLLTAHRAGGRLGLTETVTDSNESARLVRFWLIAPSSEGLWTLEVAEKNHEAVEDHWINDELEEAVGRLEDPQAASAALEVPKARLEAPSAPPPTQGPFARSMKFAASLSFFILAFVILAAFSSLQYHRMIRLVGDLNASIGVTGAKQTGAVTQLADRVAALDTELEELRSDVMRERAAFEFSRKNTAMGVRQQADDLPWSDYSRKRAYRYLADRIESAGSYGDIIREISRLPEDNAQAETVMAVDRANIVPLSSYRPVLAGLQFPVRFDASEADGQDFMISSGFGELRPSSLGTGGYLPHMAVDIINIRNILTVTPENSIVRFPGEPGIVVAAADGTVIASGYNEVFGWYVELEHEPRPEWMSQYRSMESLSTYYCHLADEPNWNPGDTVGAGEKIGDIGNTGRTTGPHLHYEVRVYRERGEFQGRNGNFDRVNPYVPADS